MKTIGGVRWALVSAAVLGALVVGATPAWAGSSGGRPYESMSLNFFTAGPIKGIATIEFADSSRRVRYALQGLPKTGQLRVVASTKPCSKAYTSASRVLAWSLGASNPTATAAGEFIVDIDLAGTGTIKSLRIFRGTGTSGQVACSKSTPILFEGAVSAAIELENTMISSYLKAPGPRGLVTVGTIDDSTIQLRAILLHKGRGTFRLVGSAAPCSQQHVGSDKVFGHTYNLADTGTHEIGHWVGIVQDTSRPSDDLRSVRLFRGEGTADQVECRGIIAVLIGL